MVLVNLSWTPSTPSTTGQGQTCWRDGEAPCPPPPPQSEAHRQTAQSSQSCSALAHSRSCISCMASGKPPNLSGPHAGIRWLKWTFCHWTKIPNNLKILLAQASVQSSNRAAMKGVGRHARAHRGQRGSGRRGRGETGEGKGGRERIL